MLPKAGKWSPVCLQHKALTVRKISQDPLPSRLLLHNTLIRVITNMLTLILTWCYKAEDLLKHSKLEVTQDSSLLPFGAFRTSRDNRGHKPLLVWFLFNVSKIFTGIAGIGKSHKAKEMWKVPQTSFAVTSLSLYHIPTAEGQLSTFTQQEGLQHPTNSIHSYQEQQHTPWRDSSPWIMCKTQQRPLKCFTEGNVPRKEPLRVITKLT